MVLDTLENKIIKPLILIGGIVVAQGATDYAIAQQNVQNKTTTQDDKHKKDINKLKFKHPIIDITTQGVPSSIVKRYCEEKIIIEPDSLITKNFPLKTVTQTRDYLMDDSNLPRVIGATIATKPEIDIYPGYDFPFGYPATNNVDFKIMPARNLIDLVSKNPNNTLADKRMIDQIKHDNYRRATIDDIEILQAIQYTIKSDATITKPEVDVIAQLMRQKGYDRLLVGVMAYHDGSKNHKGKDVKGEAIPMFLLFNAYADTVKVVIPDTSRGYSGKEKATGPASDGTRKSSGDKGFLLGAVAEFDHKQKKVIPGIELGYDFGNFGLTGIAGVNPKIINDRISFTSPSDGKEYGFQTTKGLKAFLGFDLIGETGNIVFGAGADYYLENKEIRQVLKDRHLNLDEEISKTYHGNHWRGHLQAGYKIGPISLITGVSYRPKDIDVRFTIRSNLGGGRK